MKHSVSALEKSCHHFQKDMSMLCFCAYPFTYYINIEVPVVQENSKLKYVYKKTRAKMVPVLTVFSHSIFVVKQGCQPFLLRVSCVREAITGIS